MTPGTLEGSKSLYSLVADDSELPVIQELEGKVASWLGELGDAHNFLESARRTLLAQNRLVEAGLASLDLAALHPRAQRPGEVERLIADLRRQTQKKDAGALAIEMLQRFASGELMAPPRVCAGIHGSHLLKMARLRRLGAPPMPWV